MQRQSKGHIDGFNVIKHLGAGGNATVKKVEKDGKYYAMKIFQFHPEEKTDKLKRIQKEIDVVEGLKIEGIPTTYSLVPEATWTKSDGKTFQVSYINMDLVEGIELIDFLNACGRQADPVVRYIFVELGRILN